MRDEVKELIGRLSDDVLPTVYSLLRAMVAMGVSAEEALDVADEEVHRRGLALKAYLERPL